jgi:hypothetical protein
MQKMRKPPPSSKGSGLDRSSSSPEDSLENSGGAIEGQDDFRQLAALKAANAAIFAKPSTWPLRSSGRRH